MEVCDAAAETYLPTAQNVNYFQTPVYSPKYWHRSIVINLKTINSIFCHGRFIKNRKRQSAEGYHF